MIEKHELVVVDGNEKLILFLNLYYEFGGKNNKGKSFKATIIDYIRNNKINFRGGLITFVVGGVMIGNVFFNNNEFKDYKPIDDNYGYVSYEIIQKIDTPTIVEKDAVVQKISNDNELKNNKQKETQVNNKVQDSKGANTVIKPSNDASNDNNIVNNNKDDKDSGVVDNTGSDKENIIDNNIYVNLQKRDGSTIKIELEEYVIGVVGAEMPALFNSEALKAQAVIARTYALKANSKGKVLRANESNQSYKTNEELKNTWGSNYNTYYAKIKKAVNDTEGMVLIYNGSYIEAVYHSTSNGMTESSVNVWGNYYPYLVSVSSQYDNLSVSFIKNIDVSYQELSNKLGFDVDKETNIELIGKTSGNRVESVKICDHMYKGIDFRNLLGLRSADFDIEITDTGIIFTTRGYGHGVGMSQYGANGMAKNGYNYEAILKHYYPGVSLNKI